MILHSEWDTQLLRWVKLWLITTDKRRQNKCAWCSRSSFLSTMLAFYTACAYMCMTVCAPCRISLGPSGCLNMNAWCNCPGYPTRIFHLQSPPWRNKLWQGNSGGTGLLQKPFLQPLIICQAELMGRGTLSRGADHWHGTQLDFAERSLNTWLERKWELRRTVILCESPPAAAHWQGRRKHSVFLVNKGGRKI